MGKSRSKDDVPSASEVLPEPFWKMGPFIAGTKTSFNEFRCSVCVEFCCVAVVPLKSGEPIGYCPKKNGTNPHVPGIELRQVPRRKVALNPGDVVLVMDVSFER